LCQVGRCFVALGVGNTGQFGDCGLVDGLENGYILCHENDH
jgi:hypothetical protein